MNKPIVVFGGSFNPPTNAHFGLAEQIINDYDVEKVLFMPVGDHYQKPGLLSASIRVEMLKHVCTKHDKFEVSFVEVKCERQLPTIETLKLLELEYPNQELWFVLGTDNLRDLPNWDDYEELLSRFYIFVLERGDDKALDIVAEHEVLNRLKSNIIVMKEEIRTNCSSTIVRNRLKNGKGVDYLIPEAVNRYIKEYHLYQ